MLNTSAIVAILLINAIFSGAYLFGKIGVNHFPPFLFAALRFAIVTLVLAPFLHLDQSTLKRWKLLLGFCLMMGVGVYAAMYWALHLAQGASAILVGTQLSTPIALLIGMWLLAEKVSLKAWLGVLLTMIGVGIIGFDTIILGYPMAFLWVIASACCYAGANVVLRFLKDESINLLNLNAWMALISSPILLLLSWFYQEPWQQPINNATWEGSIALLYSSLAVSLIGHMGQFKMLSYYPVAAIMPYYVFTPIFGILGAIVFLDEDLSLRFVIGAILAIVGLYTINRKEKIKTKM